MDGRLVGPGNDDYRIDRFSSDDLPERDRLAFTREVYGRVIVKHDIEPHPDSPFYWRSALRRLPGLGIASTICSGVHTERTPSQIDSDDLVINITVAGKRGTVARRASSLAASGRVMFVAGNNSILLTQSLPQ